MKLVGEVLLEERSVAALLVLHAAKAFKAAEFSAACGLPGFLHAAINMRCLSDIVRCLATPMHIRFMEGAPARQGMQNCCSSYVPHRHRQLTVLDICYNPANVYH